MNESVYYIDDDSGEAWTFADDGELMKKLFIVQCVFLIPLTCSMVCGVMGATAGFVIEHD